MIKSSSSYLQTIFYNHLNIGAFPSGYVRREQLRSAIDQQIKEYCRSHHGAFNLDLSTVVDQIFEDWIQFDLIEFDSDEFAGEYCSIRRDELRKFRSLQLSDNPILARLERIGGGYFSAVLEGILAKGIDAPSLELGLRTQSFAPGADRIVTFADNQISDLEAQTDQVIAALNEKNNVEGGFNLKEVILGQLRAGRELIRAGCARLYLLELTLISTLGFLIQRYEHDVIGELAGALIEALLKYIGIAN